jgi:TolB-like protein/Tfp pilus assembly protein PilF
VTEPTEQGGEGTWAKLRRRKVVQWGIAYVAAGWGLLQGLEYVSGLYDWSRQYQQIAMLVLLIGIPIVLVLAWYHGDRGQQHFSAARGSVAEPAPAATKSAATPTVADARPSIAVLPFDNRSDKHEDTFFVDGIHDDILTQLTKVSAMRVIARTSVQQFRGTKLTTREIGEKLGVTMILEGGVQRASDRVRITVQLIDAGTDAHMWADSYDRELTAGNIFAIQSEVAAAIAVALKTTLTSGEKASVNAVPTQNLEAWEAFQRGKQRMARRTSAALADSVAYFQKAIDADLGFALAYVGMADALLVQFFYQWAPRAACLARAEVAIGKALALDPNLAEAHTSLASLHEKRGAPERAEVEYRKAIELNPNYSPAHHWYANLLASHSRFGEALQAAKRAEALDPLSAIINNMVAQALHGEGRFEEALAGYRKALENDPEMPVVYANVALLQAYAYARFDAAAPFFEKASSVDPKYANVPALMGQFYLDLGDDTLAQQSLNRAMQVGADNELANDVMATWHLYRGEQPKALAFARRGSLSNPSPWSSGLALARDADLAAGDGQAARERYEKAFPELLGATPPTIDGQNYRAAVALAIVLQKTGERDRADQLLDRSEQFIRTLSRLGEFGYGITDVQIFALRGEKREALAALRAAETARWRGPSWRYYRDFDPALASIRGEPEFKGVFADIERDMARQRVELAKRPKDAPLDLAAVH